MSSYFSRQGKVKIVANKEEEVMRKAKITPDDVLALNGPTDGEY